MGKTYVGAVSHDNRAIEELAADPEFAIEYLKAAMAEADTDDGKVILLNALRQIAEAHGGVAKIAEQSGIPRESLYRSLSAKGNPTLSTLLSVLNTMGLQLTVIPHNNSA